MKSKVRELFQDEKSVFIFDMDGVLCPLEFDCYHHHYHFDDEVWGKEILKRDMYENCRPLKTFQNFFQSKDMNRVYVVTKVMNEEEERQKIRYAQRNYGILKQHVYTVKENEEKLDILRKIQTKYPDLDEKYFLFVDDTVSVLNYVMENSSFTTVHISSFLE